MPQHDECNLCVEDFEKSERSQPCDGCFALDGRRCLGVSHKRKDTGKVIVPRHALKLFLHIISHFSISLTRTSQLISAPLNSTPLI